jgi:hypothetical protein
MWESVFGVGIGLILIFLVISLIVSGIQEIIATLFKLRAKTLDKGLRAIFADDNHLQTFYRHSLIKALSPAPGKRPSYIPSQWFATAVLDQLDVAAGSGATSWRDTVAKLDAENNALAGVVKSLAARGGGDLDSLQADLARWFDDAMDRVSGWYARTARWIGLGVAALVVILMNVDTIRIAGTIWQSAALQTTLAELAQEVGSEGATNGALDKVVVERVLASVPIGWQCPVLEPATGGAAASEAAGGICVPENWSWSRLLGWAITIFAVSLGAPFWFDLLSRVSRVRGSGEKPDRAKPAKPTS